MRKARHGALWRLASALLVGATPAAPSAPIPDPGIVEALQPIRNRHHLPALAGAIVTGEGLAAQGVVGVRKAGTDVPATLDDLWHLGSDTKAMTATAVARLVEEGKLDWDSTLAGLFPDRAPSMHPAFRGVTIRQLLSHRAGLQPDLDWQALARRGTPTAQRLRALEIATTSAPPFAVGQEPHYANLGYVLAGAALERRTGQPYEEILRAYVFEPLGMSTAGLGGTGTPGDLNQPWPHTYSGKPAASNGPEADNPPVISPAGRVHCTLADWARFISDQLRGARGETALLKPGSYAVLQTAAGEGDFALGWVTARRDWGEGPVLTHSGCNTMNFATAWLAPKRNFAVLVVTNQGDKEAARGADEAAAALVALWLQRSPPPRGPG